MTDFEQFGHNIHDKPKMGTSLGLVDYDFPKISVDALEQKYGKKLKKEPVAAAIDAPQPSARKPLLKRIYESIFS